MTSSDYWPGLTPLTLREITYDEWLGFALTFDATAEDRRRQAQQARTQHGRRR